MVLRKFTAASKAGFGPMASHESISPPRSALDGIAGFSYFSRMSKPARAGDTAKGSVPFEDALNKLEGVVEAMEADDLPLETLLTKYEEGARLVKVCQEKLAEAEVKIQQLEKNAAGEMKLKPLDAGEEA
jgi:exodeoxyribonuclease VII small subunit